jgi:hypothetical protein
VLAVVCLLLSCLELATGGGSLGGLPDLVLLFVVVEDDANLGGDSRNC